VVQEIKNARSACAHTEVSSSYFLADSKHGIPTTQPGCGEKSTQKKAFGLDCGPALEIGVRYKQMATWLFI